MDVKAILDEYGISYVEMDTRYLVCCPFHDDNDPSCGVWKDSGYFKCFGCHETGDLAELVGEFAGIPAAGLRKGFKTPTAIENLEDRLRNFLDTPETSDIKYFSKKSFNKNYPPIMPGTPAHIYLTGDTRKLKDHTIKRFNLRLGTGKYSNRVVVPIYMPDGKLLSYAARAYRNRIRPKTKKARSSHRTFYGLYELLRDTPLGSSRSTIVVVEGEFDAMYLQQCGVPAVSNMGTTPLNGYKISLLRKYASKVILSYDPDDAGEGAMYGKEGKRGWIPGTYDTLNKHVPTLTLDLPGKDPNDMTFEEVVKIYGEWIADESANILRGFRADR